MFLLELPNMTDGDAGRGIAAEEELEQEFVAGRVVAIGHGEPQLEAGMAGRGEEYSWRLVLAVRARSGYNEAFGGKPLEGGVELAIAFAPEEADGLLDGLADLVSGLVGMDGEDAEDDVGGSFVLHIAIRYI
jgi:hypothetical protein